MFHRPKSIITRFHCQNCGYRFQKSYKWALSSSMCPKCQHNVFKPFEEIEEKSVNPVIHRKPLTNWEKKKLEFYKSEKAWHKDIESRRVLPNGDVAIVNHKGEITEVRPRR